MKLPDLRRRWWPSCRAALVGRADLAAEELHHAQNLRAQADGKAEGGFEPGAGARWRPAGIARRPGTPLSQTGFSSAQTIPGRPTRGAYFMRRVTASNSARSSPGTMPAFDAGEGARPGSSDRPERAVLPAQRFANVRECAAWPRSAWRTRRAPAWWRKPPPGAAGSARSSRNSYFRLAASSMSGIERPDYISSGEEVKEARELKRSEAKGQASQLPLLALLPILVIMIRASSLTWKSDYSLRFRPGLSGYGGLCGIPGGRDSWPHRIYRPGDPLSKPA